MTVYRFEDIAFNSTEKKKPVEEDKYTYLGLEHLDPDSIYVTRYGADIAPKGEKLIMKKGDVLFGKRRAYQKKVAIAPFDGIFSAHGMVLRPKEDVIDKDFFPLFIKSDYFLDEAIKISVGSLSPTINWKNLKELKFELPSLSEQKKLAAVLWSIYETKEEYKKLIDATDELIKSQFIKMFGTADSWLAGDTGKYNYEKLGKLTNIRTGKLDANAAEGGDYPFFSCSAETLMIDRYSYDCECVLVAGNGDFNVKYYNGKFDAYQRTYIIESNTERLSVPFLYLFMMIYVDTLKHQSIGSVIKYIKLGNLIDALIPFPPLNVQEQFVMFAEQCDKSKFALQEAIKDLEAMSKKIIAESLMTAGKE